MNTPASTPRSIAVYCLVAASAFLAYAQTFRFPFVNFDDPWYVYANPQVQLGINVDSLRWAFTTGHQGNWHPLTWLSHMLDWRLFGEWAGGHHLTSVLLHATASVLLLHWLYRATAAIAPSLFAAMVFALHPLHVESVAWISERKDVLCALFFIAGLHAYTRYARQPQIKTYIMLVLMFVLALLSKPMAVTFPLVLFLVDFWPLNKPWTRNSLLEKAPLFALSCIHGVITIIVQQSAGFMRSLDWTPLTARIANAAVSYLMYALKTVLPMNLAVYYPYPVEGPSPLLVIGGAVLLIAGSLAAWRYRSRAPYAFTGWFWFVIMLMPVIGIVQVGAQAYADRYMYLPQIGLTIAIAWGIRAWSMASETRTRVARALGFVVVMACFFTTVAQVSTWRDSVSLFTEALAATKQNATAHLNLGDAYFSLKQFEKSAEHSLEALRIDPRQVNAQINLGLVRAEQKRWPEAEAAWRDALRIDDRNAAATCYLGYALESQGNVVEAAREYEASVRLDPTYALAHEKLGGALLLLGQGEQAKSAYQAAIALNPLRSGTWASLGVTLCSLDQCSESLPYFEKALELDSGNPDARFFYARALQASGAPTAAARQLDILLSEYPNHPEGSALRAELGISP